MIFFVLTNEALQHVSGIADYWTKTCENAPLWPFKWFFTTGTIHMIWAYVFSTFGAPNWRGIENCLWKCNDSWRFNCIDYKWKVRPKVQESFVSKLKLRLFEILLLLHRCPMFCIITFQGNARRNNLKTKIA